MDAEKQILDMRNESMGYIYCDTGAYPRTYEVHFKDMVILFNEDQIDDLKEMP